MERRNFVKNISVASAALLFAPSLTVFSQSLSASPVKPGGLLPFILFEDCNLLIQQSEQVKAEMKELLKGDIHQKLLSNLSRLAASFDNQAEITTLMGKLKADKASKKTPQYDEKLSFVLGWLIAKASMKEIGLFNQKLVGKGQPIDQIRAYQDVEIIRARFMKPGATVSADDFSSLMLQMITRVVTRIHTLTPDKNDGGNWIVRTSDWRENNKKTMELYGEIMETPDKAKRDLYCQKGNLIRPGDPLIANHFRSEYLGNDNKSLYAKAVANGYQAILTFQSYFEGKADLTGITKLI